MSGSSFATFTTRDGAPVSLGLRVLSEAYARGALSPSDLAGQIADSEVLAVEGVFISRVPGEELRRAAVALERRRAAGAALPLYGIPFAVKDNIDVLGLPTTAACPDYAYQPTQSATVVQRLLDAGALVVGKTNLDQFATGLVGVRSPYGIPGNPFHPGYICGGSSSGSAAAVARGLVSFALGTDTAGSGRVPAAFTNTVGWKPSPGVLSTSGVVPACRSLDCVSVFALDVADARRVVATAAGFDALDPFSRPGADEVDLWADGPGRAEPGAPFTCGVLAAADRAFFGDQAAAAAYDAALARLSAMGAELVAIDMAPFFQAAALLYEGAWLAERLAGLASFVTAKPEALLPVTRQILLGGAEVKGTEVFEAIDRLAHLRRAVHLGWQRIDTLVLPTTPTIHKIDEVNADPLRKNAQLGRYTNFANLLELAAIAVPNGFRPDGLPTGVTFFGPWGSEGRLGRLAERFHQQVGGNLGAGSQPLPPPEDQPRPPSTAGAGALRLRIAVVGAHLRGQPLNHQLTERGGQLVRAARTAPLYRLFALPGTSPPKPGLVRQRDGRGAPIELEVWDLPTETVGGFLAGVSQPLGLGWVELEDGERVIGFLCEAYATEDALDISHLGGWRAFLARG